MQRPILFLTVVCSLVVWRTALAGRPAAKKPAASDAAAMKKVEAPRWTVPGIGVAMRRIPAGTFLMGSPPDELARKADERPHKVTISRPFYMAIHETRQREYYPLMIRPEYDLEAWGYQDGPRHEGAACGTGAPAGSVTAPFPSTR